MTAIVQDQISHLFHQRMNTIMPRFTQKCVRDVISDANHLTYSRRVGIRYRFYDSDDVIHFDMHNHLILNKPIRVGDLNLDIITMATITTMIFRSIIRRTKGLPVIPSPTVTDNFALSYVDNPIHHAMRCLRDQEDITV